MQRYGFALICLILLAVALVIYLFNKLVRMRNRLREAWSGVEVQLKRRHDLVPSLVECVKAYQKHESEVLVEVIKQRSAARDAKEVNLQSEQEGKLGRGISQVIALAESYPELLASDAFRNLSQDLVDIEDSLQYARRYYNGSARDLNNLVQSFPSLIIAQLFGFKQVPFFEVEHAAERLAPNVKGGLE